MDTDCSRHRDMFQRRLREALQAKKKLGCFTNTLDFIETAYAETAIKHELPSLFTTNTCSHCHAHRWKEERPGFCCEKGRVHLDDLPEPPADIRRLYERSRSFLDNLRSYNNALAMASIGCDEAVIVVETSLSCLPLSHLNGPTSQTSVRKTRERNRSRKSTLTSVIA